jgi:hypothetical protein
VLILFAISIVSFLALIGVGVAMVRHVRASHRNERIGAPPEPSFGQHLYAASEYGSVRAPRRVRQQRVESITANKAWNKPSQSVEIHPAAEEEPSAAKRKAPQTAVAQRAEFASNRTDWTHFNKDYGDLTDPHPSRPVRAASGRTASRRRY